MLPGHVVAGRFVVELTAGSGGMGIVYRARDSALGGVVALKVLRSVEDDEHAKRFARETSILAELQHPAIVAYVDHGTTEDGRRYLAMEWLEGETLSQRLAHRPLLLKESVTVVNRVAEALAFAHRRRVVHRDIKPSNIFLPGGDPSRSKLLDFGLARLSSHQSLVTAQGQLLGTPAYMSPEQARGRADADPRSDVFALGSVLYHCVTGQRPFAGVDLAAVLAKILFEEPASVSELAPAAPPELCDLVTRMMSKDPARRPNDAGDIAGALASLGDFTVVAERAAAPASSRQLTDSEVGVFSVAVVGGQASPSERVREQLSPFGGRFERLREGSWLFALGGRGNAVDQAAQAARAALVIQRHRPDAPVVLATGRGVLNDRLPVGEVIERAFAMVRSAERSPSVSTAGIHVDETTAGLLGGRFEVARHEGLWLLKAAREHAEPVRVLLGKPTPCVGRERELTLLAATFDECAGEPAARVVLVTAPAGVGKSRLRYELLHRLAQRSDQPQVWVGRGDPTSAGSPFAMIAPVVRRAAGIGDGESLELQQGKLRARIARHVASGDLDRVAHFIGELCGVPFDAQASRPLAAARADPMLMADQMQRAWEDFVAAECSVQPLLLVLEDLHWGDRPSVRFVDASLRRLTDRPLMVVALARPEVHGLFPGLWGERALQEIRLGAITRSAGEKLVRAALGDGVTAEMLSSIVDRATGNAFYLEELIRAVAEGRGSSLPDSVRAMVHARLGMLEVEAKRILRAASVFGQVFWSDGVEALVGGPDRAADVGAWLDALVDRELVTRRGECRFPTGREYTFRHALLREGAYDMLTEEDRGLGHRLAGAWLAQAGERDAVVLADHFRRGNEPERAVDWYRRAAHQALEANDFEAAISRAGHGLECGATGEIAGELKLVEAEAHRWRAEWPQAETNGREALALLRRGSMRWCVAAGELASTTFTLGHKDLLQEVVDDLAAIDVGPEARGAHCIALARAGSNELYAGRYERAHELEGRVEALAMEAGPNDTAALAWRDRLRAVTALYGGDLGGYLTSSASGLSHYQRMGDLRGECMMRSSCGDAYKELGLFVEAEGELRKAGELADRLGIQTNVAFAKCALSYVLAQRGSFDEALTLGVEARSAFEKQNDRRLAGGTGTYLAHILSRAGDMERAEHEARAAQELLSLVPPLRAVALATLARILLARGQDAEALSTAAQATEILESLGQLEEGESLVRLVHVEALLAAGDEAAAHASLAEARSSLLKRAARVVDEAFRASFLQNVPENARTMQLASRVLGPPEGRPAPPV